ncbi:MAG: lipopolysaccharide kinase InaA family protein [Thermodesulfobacteriota bacterium]|nr:lipopolysaccharide kinase InaA family protein [Thermodesulfobacteriota bacterium]
MSTALTRTYNSYHFGSSFPLTDEQLKQLVGLFEAPTNAVDSVLGGRTSVAISRIEGLGSVVVKYYTRGGLLRLLVERTYLKWGKTRCQIEYELFQKVRDLGVSVPEPIAYASQGGLFYRGWLVTRQIKGQQTLAQLAFSDVERVCTVMREVAHHVSTLINNYILHVDLHPGNVLVDSGNRTFLVDFDKACLCPGDKNRLRHQYLTRWRRSVTKHGLPEVLYDAMSAALQ